MNTARLNWTLYIDCPACDAMVDLVDQDDNQIFATAIFNNKWGSAKGEEVFCDECNHEFKVDDIEY